MHGPAKAVALHVPGAVPGLKEAVFTGRDGGISKNLGVISRIDAVEAARFHKPTLVVGVRPSSRRDAENTEDGDNRMHDKVPSAHSSLAILPRLRRASTK